MSASSSDLVRTTTRSTLWSYGATYGGKALMFVTQIILLLLLTETDFGVVALGLTVIAFLEVMQDLGIGSAVVYENDESVANTAFWLGLIVALSLFGLTWISAPLIASTFLQNNPTVTPIIRALGFSFPLFALRNIHDALLRKRLQFKRRFVPDLTQMLSKGIISIGLALAGFGAWSLVWGQLAGSACGVVAYWIVNPWRPALTFDRTVQRSLLRFGTGIVVINGLSVVLAQFDYLMVGRYLGEKQLGIYRSAFTLTDLMVMQVCVALASVLYPVYARLRNDREGLQQGFFIASRYVALVTVPLSLGIALVAEPFVLTLLSERWIATIPIMRLIAIYTLFLSLGYNVGDVYKARNQARILTILSLIRLAALMPALWWAAAWSQSIITVGIVHAVMAFLGSLLNLVVAARMLKMPFIRILQSFQPAFIGGAVMSIAIIACLVALRSTPSIVQLFVATIVGIASYAGTLWWGQREVITQARQTLRGAVARK